MPPPGPPPLVGAPPPAPTSSGPLQAVGANPLLTGNTLPPPPPLPRTFASMIGAHAPPTFCPLASLPSIPRIPLSSFSSSSLDGLPLISFSPSDYMAASAFNSLTLLARFARCVPPMNSFDLHINTTWGLSKPATVDLLNPRTISIHMQSQDDLSIAWSRISRSFNGQSFLLLRWSPDSKRHDSPLAAI
ncbi:DUF4283 domain-containing protein [Cephalotus follicularis]|uniref:DUF4283 domain-containing protein n=1 Tax=Cephalotus follicularis TaxID=3775 RepID=A0A1Q3B031_CEPFO|nr:DUF4283 domain-containing protein [Cephalotus follicularis]